MGFGDIIGQDNQLDTLRRMVRTGRVPHALLFHGPDGVGKRTVAVEFGASLLCLEQGEESCGECISCRKVAHSNHGDFFFIRREPKKQGREELSQFIVVDQIRRLSELAVYSPSRGKARVFIIEPADRMNTEAQNALLKTLEEPPGRSVLILVTSRPNVLLPTVRSRCLALRFNQVPTTVLTRFLQERGSSPSEAAARAALSGGRPGMALELDPEKAGSMRHQLLRDLEALASSPIAVASLADMVARLAGDGETEFLEGLELCQGLLRDSARAAIGDEPADLLHADLHARLAELGSRLGHDRAAELVAGIDQLRGCMRFNVNRNLLAETLLAAVAGGPLPG